MAKDYREAPCRANEAQQAKRNKLTLAGACPARTKSRRQASGNYDRLAVMRRAQIILVIAALLAAPLALFARGMACDFGACTAICCLPHGSANVSSAHGRRVLCGVPSSAEAHSCGMKHPGHSPLDYGFIEPIAPTAPSAHVSLTAPTAVRQDAEQFSESILSGFRTSPFQPPRA
jgi:hypothetical protein